MAAYLPSIVPGSFGSQFDGTPCASRTSSCRAAALNSLSDNRAYSAYGKRRKPSGVPFISSHSSPHGPHSLNNENTEPSTPKQGLSPYTRAECLAQKTASSPVIPSPPWTDQRSHTTTFSSDRDVAPLLDKAPLREIPFSLAREASKIHQFEKRKVSQTLAEPGLELTPEPEKRYSSEEVASNQFSKWADSFRKRRDGMVSINARVYRQKTGRNIDIDGSSVYTRTFPLRRNRLKKCTSFSSSGFVETVKTASFSTSSLGLMPSSLRNSRFSDGVGNRSSVVSSSYARLSSESDTLQNASSLDEGAQQRAIKRRQVLDELLVSEEGYVADLKMLTNLFSTILTSLPSIGVKIRSSIQHNVMMILHLHETFANDIRQSSQSHTATTVDFAIRRRRNIHRHTKWHSLDYQSCNVLEAHPGVVRKSFDVPRRSEAVVQQSVNQPIAQGSEAAEVARIIKRLVGKEEVYKRYRHTNDLIVQISQFFAYEEYCSKYELMVQEIGNPQKNLPGWQNYESGVEALARSMSALDARLEDQHKCLTVGDLLIKPIQRICRYPLLLAELHKHTHVVDCPVAHMEIESALVLLREAVQIANRATDDPVAQGSVQRTWLLREKLIFANEHVAHPDRLAQLGHVKVCGILYVAYQTRARVKGEYMLCALFSGYLLLARASRIHDMFDVIAIISLVDSKVESAEDGKGLQCHNALYSWKLVFESNDNFYELIFSACSAAEEEQWRKYLQEFATLVTASPTMLSSTHMQSRTMTTLSLDLKSLGPVHSDADSFSRRLSIQRAATVGTRSGLCQVIIRNTVNLAEDEERRDDTADAVNRSQSLLTTHRVGVLAPKRSERVRLEHCIQDVWSRDIIPFPGMTLSRGGSIIRASAGSLVRRLSRASMHGPFSRRSTSITVTPSRGPGEENQDSPAGQPLSSPQNQLHTTEVHRRTKSNTENNRLIRSSGEQKVEPRRMSTGVTRMPWAQGNKDQGQTVKTLLETDSRRAFEREIVEEKLEGKKRWSNPLGLLKHISTDGVRHFLYSSKPT